MAAARATGIVKKSSGISRRRHSSWPTTISCFRTAIYSTQSRVKYEYRWIPFVLSFLAGFINLYALLVIACAYKITLDEMDRSAAAARADEAPPSGDPIAVKCASNRRLFYAVFGMLCFVVFFIITLVGCYTVTCGAAMVEAPASPDFVCFLVTVQFDFTNQTHVYIV